MPHSIDIIRAEVDHLDMLIPLFDGYRQFYDQPSDLDGARAFLKQRLHHDDSVLFLALLNDAPVGFVQLYPSWSSVSMKQLWILNDLFVAEIARRHGIARALILRAEQFAVKLQAKGLVLETAHNNYSAQKLYEQLGWKREQEFYRYYRYF